MDGGTSNWSLDKLQETGEGRENKCKETAEQTTFSEERAMGIWKKLSSFQSKSMVSSIYEDLWLIEIETAQKAFLTKYFVVLFENEKYKKTEII